MGSDLYRVKVLEKRDRTVSLRVEVVHPDANYLSSNEAFALMVLHEGTRGALQAPLAQEISFNDTLDRGWLELYTLGFIEAVAVKVESGNADAQDSKDWFKGTLTITVTDPAWLAHLEAGAEFDSRAFDAASSFQPCAPIRPGQVDPNAPVPEAFVAVPGSLWESSGLPAVVRGAAYSPSAYRSPNLRKGTFNAADLRDLDGQVVVYQGPYDESLQVGLLALQGEQIRLFTVSDGGYGSSGNSPFEGSIGLAELIPGKRLGTKLRVSGLLRNLKPEVRAATVEGDVASFRVALPPGAEPLDALSEEQRAVLGFQLLVTPLLPTDSFATKLFQPAPLAWTIEREVLQRYAPEERQMSQYIDGKMIPSGDVLPEESGLASRFASGFVARVEVVAAGKPTDANALDALPEVKQREVLAAPWVEATVKVTPRHAVYLQHLGKPLSPWTLPQYFGDAQPWEGELPAPATAPTGFGQAKAPAPSSAGSSQQQSQSPAAPAAPNKMLKMVGIGCAVLVGLMLLCLIGGAIVGK